jgi:hypothetical protein
MVPILHDSSFGAFSSRGPTFRSASPLRESSRREMRQVLTGRSRRLVDGVGRRRARCAHGEVVAHWAASMRPCLRETRCHPPLLLVQLNHVHNLIHWLCSRIGRPVLLCSFAIVAGFLHLDLTGRATAEKSSNRNPVSTRNKRLIKKTRLVR